MGIFDRFRRKGKEAPQEQPPAEAPAAAPAPEAAPAPPPAPEGGKRRGGLLGRLFGRKPKEEPTPPPTTPEAPPAPEEAAPPAPPGPPGPPAPPAAAPGEEPEEEDYSWAPPSLSVQIPGAWQVSRTRWSGVVGGVLSGADVVEFLKAMDQGRDEDAVMLVCRAYDDGSGFADLVDLEASTWVTPQYQI